MPTRMAFQTWWHKTRDLSSSGLEQEHPTHLENTKNWRAGKSESIAFLIFVMPAKEVSERG